MFAGQVRKYVDSAVESFLSPFVDSLDKAGAPARKPKIGGKCPSRDGQPISRGSGLQSRSGRDGGSEFAGRKKGEKLLGGSSGEKGSEKPRFWWAPWGSKNENENAHPRQLATSKSSALPSEEDPFTGSDVSTDAQRRRENDLSGEATSSAERTRQTRGRMRFSGGASPTRKDTSESSLDEDEPSSPYGFSPSPTATGSGDIVYTNIRLRRDLLSSSGLPFVLSQGVISSLRISIPPLLSLAPIVISVEDVLLLFTPLPGNQWSPSEVRRLAQQHRRALIADLEEQIENQVRGSLHSRNRMRSSASETGGAFGSSASHSLPTARYLAGSGMLRSATDVSALGGAASVGADAVGGGGGVTGGSRDRERTRPAAAGGGGVQAYIRNNIEQWLLGRLKVSIRNVHVRYEHPGGASGAPFSWGVIIPFILLNRGMPDASSTQVTHAAAAAAAAEREQRQATEQQTKRNRGKPAHVSGGPRIRRENEASEQKQADGRLRNPQSPINTGQAAALRGGTSRNTRSGGSVGDSALDWRVDGEEEDRMSEGRGATGENKEPVSKILLCSIAMYWNSGDLRLISETPKAIERLYLLAAPVWSSSPVSAARTAAAEAELAATELAAVAAAGKGREGQQGTQGLLLRTPPEPPLPVCTSIELGGNERGDKAKQKVVSAPASPSALARTRKADRGLEGCSWLLRLSFFEFSVVLQPSEEESTHNFDLRVEGHVDPVVLHVSRDMLTDMRSLQMHLAGFNFFKQAVLVSPALFRCLRDQHKSESCSCLRSPRQVENASSALPESVAQDSLRWVFLPTSHSNGKVCAVSACQRLDESAKDSQTGSVCSAPSPGSSRGLAALSTSDRACRSHRARRRWRFAVTAVCWLRQLQELRSSMHSLVSPPVLTILKQQRAYIELRCRYRCEVAKRRAARGNASLLSRVYGKSPSAGSMEEELAKDLRRMEEEELLYLPTELVLLWHRQAVLDPALPPYDLFLLHRHPHADEDELETDSEELKSREAADTQAVTEDASAESHAVKARKGGRREVTFAAEHLESDVPHARPRGSFSDPVHGFAAARSLPPLSISPFTFSASLLPRRIRRMVRSLFPGDDRETTPHGNGLPVTGQLFQQLSWSSGPEATRARLPPRVRGRLWSSPHRWASFQPAPVNRRWAAEALGGSPGRFQPPGTVQRSAVPLLPGGGWRHNARRWVLGKNAAPQSDGGLAFSAPLGDSASLSDPVDDGGMNGWHYPQQRPHAADFPLLNQGAAGWGPDQTGLHWGGQGIHRATTSFAVPPLSSAPYAVPFAGTDEAVLRHIGSLKRSDSTGMQLTPSGPQGLSPWQPSQDAGPDAFPFSGDATHYPWEEGQQAWQKQQAQLHRAAMLELQTSMAGGPTWENTPQPKNVVGWYPSTLGPDPSATERYFRGMQRSTTEAHALARAWNQASAWDRGSHFRGYPGASTRGMAGTAAPSSPRRAVSVSVVLTFSAVGVRLHRLEEQNIKRRSLWRLVEYSRGDETSDSSSFDCPLVEMHVRRPRSSKISRRRLHEAPEAPRRWEAVSEEARRTGLSLSHQRSNVLGKSGRRPRAQGYSARADRHRVQGAPGPGLGGLEDASAAHLRSAESPREGRRRQARGPCLPYGTRGTEGRAFLPHEEERAWAKAVDLMLFDLAFRWELLGPCSDREVEDVAHYSGLRASVEVAAVSRGMTSFRPGCVNSAGRFSGKRLALDSPSAEWGRGWTADIRGSRRVVWQLVVANGYLGPAEPTWKHNIPLDAAFFGLLPPPCSIHLLHDIYSDALSGFVPEFSPAQRGSTTASRGQDGGVSDVTEVPARAPLRRVKTGLPGQPATGVLDASSLTREVETGLARTRSCAPGAKTPYNLSQNADPFSCPGSDSSDGRSDTTSKTCPRQQRSPQVAKVNRLASNIRDLRPSDRHVFRSKFVASRAAFSRAGTSFPLQRSAIFAPSRASVLTTVVERYPSRSTSLQRSLGTTSNEDHNEHRSVVSVHPSERHGEAGEGLRSPYSSSQASSSLESDGNADFDEESSLSRGAAEGRDWLATRSESDESVTSISSALLHCSCSPTTFDCQLAMPTFIVSPALLRLAVCLSSIFDSPSHLSAKLKLNEQRRRSAQGGNGEYSVREKLATSRKLLHRDSDIPAVTEIDPALFLPLGLSLAIPTYPPPSSSPSLAACLVAAEAAAAKAQEEAATAAMAAALGARENYAPSETNPGDSNERERSRDSLWTERSLHAPGPAFSSFSGACREMFRSVFDRSGGREMSGLGPRRETSRKGGCTADGEHRSESLPHTAVRQERHGRVGTRSFEFEGLTARLLGNVSQRPLQSHSRRGTGRFSMTRLKETAAVAAARASSIVDAAAHSALAAISQATAAANLVLLHANAAARTHHSAFRKANRCKRGDALLTLKHLSLQHRHWVVDPVPRHARTLQIHLTNLLVLLPAAVAGMPKAIRRARRMENMVVSGNARGMTSLRPPGGLASGERFVTDGNSRLRDPSGDTLPFEPSLSPEAALAIALSPASPLLAPASTGAPSVLVSCHTLAFVATPETPSSPDVKAAAVEGLQVAVAAQLLQLLHILHAQTVSSDRAGANLQEFADQGVPLPFAPGIPADVLPPGQLGGCDGNPWKEGADGKAPNAKEQGTFR